MRMMWMGIRLSGLVVSLILLIAAAANYPIQRELMIVYLVTGALTAAARLIRKRKWDLLWLLTRKLVWYEAVPRGLLIGLLMLLCFRGMDYFHANAGALITMVLLGVGAAGTLLSLVPEHLVKVRNYVLIGAVPAVLLYYVLGILISGFSQPKVSDEYKENFSAEVFYGDSEAEDRAIILEDNGEALVERVRMIEHAKEEVILSTFDFRDDESGKVMLAALYQAAERGVKVQVVVDGVSGFMRLSHNPYFYALSSHENAQIRIYNPVNLLTPWALMGRLHDKYVIADDTVYVLGGRNTFSYFLGDTDGHKNYDRDALVYNGGDSEDSSLYQVKEYFEEIWSLPATKTYVDDAATARRVSVVKAARELNEVYEAYVKAHPQVLDEPDYTAMTYPVNKISLLANPTGIYAKEPTLFYALTELMQGAKEQVTIHTPYIICNQMMYDAFHMICEKVPDVRLMTNSVANNGNPFGAGDYADHFDEIAATGLSLYEYEGGVSYHGKSIVIDDRLAIVGSFNMDMRSVYLDTELMLVIDSPQVTEQLRGILESYEADSASADADGTRTYPVGVVPQEMSTKKKIRVTALYSLLRWARRLL